MRRAINMAVAAVAMLLVGMCLLAGPAFAACSGAISGAAPAPSISGYDPFAASDTISSTYAVTVINSGNQSCASLSLAFYSETTASTGVAISGSNALSFEIAASAGGPNSINSGTPPNITSSAITIDSSSVAAGATTSIPFVVRVARGAVVPPGVYQGTVSLGVYYPSGGSNLKRGSTSTVTVSITVGAQMSVNIAGGSSLATTLAFGNLVANDVRSVGIQARSNQGFKFTATSDNGGVMKLDPNPGDGVNWQVPYTVKINNGSPLTLSSAQSVAISSAATTVAGVNVPVQVTLGNPAGQRAGTYKDVITVKIEANP